MPAQLRGEKTKSVIQSTMALTMRVNISSVPVAQAAGGIRVRARPRRPAATPRLRKAQKV